MNGAINFLTLIGRDMLEPVGYLPWGIAAGSMFLLLWKIKNWKKESGQRDNRRKWSLFLSVVYLTVLLKLAFFSREPGSRIGIDLELFGTWGDSLISKAYFVENIVMFIPFGVLFPLGFQKFQSWKFCVGAGCLFSVCLEMVQIVTQRGFCQLDDVVTNTLGTLIGWGFFWIIKNQKKIFFS